MNQDNNNDQADPTNSTRTTVQLHGTDDSLNIRENFGNIRNQVKAQRGLNQPADKGQQRSDALGGRMAALFKCCIRPQNCQ